ncbi:MAG: RDD family protein [Planctomycetaceae bacterium]|nr:RDD family protein [Planctomycetaceae bacterium]
MPVKVRCRGCEKVLNAPDQARGKVVKCPHCQTKLKVPDGKSTPAKQPAAKQPAAKPERKVSTKAPGKKGKSSGPPLSETELFANLDFGKAEDTEHRICPYCATELEEDRDVCPGCGMNVALGQMDKREAKRRSRRGPDPAKFYKAAWTDSFQFVKEHKGLALRTGSYLTIFTVLCWSCFYMYDEVCVNGPPKFFWACCTFISAMGLPGWFFFLSMKIVDYSIIKGTKLDRIHFDFFQCVTLGMRTIFWPLVMLIPVFPLAVLFQPKVLLLPLWPIVKFLFPSVTWSLDEFRNVFIFLGVLGFVPLVMLPLAIPHMTAKYTYKAWILWEMIKVFGKNAAPALYWVFLALVTLILPFGAIFGAIQFYGGGLNPYYNEHFTGLTNSMLTPVFAAMDMDPEGWMYSAAIALLRFGLAFVVAVPLFLVAGFPILFLMRANGLLAYYRQQYLDLVMKMGTNTPAGFWVRMLAFLVDVLLFPLASFIVTKERRILLIAQFLNGIAVAGYLLFGVEFTKALMAPVWLSYNYWMYFAAQEATTQRTTIGKDAFGLIVSTQEDKKMGLREATIRLACTAASLVTLGLGFLVCAFHPQKKALHDMLSKTKVVWQGDR